MVNVREERHYTGSWLPHIVNNYEWDSCGRINYHCYSNFDSYGIKQSKKRTQYLYDGIFTFVPIPAIPTLISIYPNPAKNKITLSFPNTSSASIKIRSIEGALVREEKSTTEKVRVSTANWPSGIYLVEATTEVGVFRQKVVIQR